MRRPRSSPSARAVWRIAWSASTTTSAAAAGSKAVLTTYADIALAGYEDSLATAEALDTAIDALVDQTKTIEKIVAALDLGSLEFEGSDSLDNPEAVFQ